MKMENVVEKDFVTVHPKWIWANWLKPFQPLTAMYFL